MIDLREALERIAVDCEAPATPDFTDADCRKRCAIVAREALDAASNAGRNGSQHTKGRQL